MSFKITKTNKKEAEREKTETKQNAGRTERRIKVQRKKA